MKYPYFSRFDFFLFFYIFALRYFLSSFHAVSFQSIIGGLSLISIHTITSLVFMCVFLYLNRFLLFKVSLFIALIFLALFSAALNGSWGYSIPELIKIIYLCLLVVFLFNLAIKYDFYTISYILILLTIPVAFTQILSYLLGQGKATEGDGSISFIGLYFHEAVFSTVILFQMFLSIFLYSKRFKPKFCMLVFFISIISIALSNYRTTFIAALPLIILFVHLTSSKFDKLSKLLITSIAIVSFLSFLPIFIFSERFYDIYLAFENLNLIFISPDLFDRPMMQIMSGRLYFWSQYIYEFSLGSSLQIIFGNGLGSWQEWALLYAHNQFVSYLYELGFLGLVLVVSLYLYPIYNILKCRSLSSQDSKLVVSFITSFSLLSLSTMPLWSIEGIFIFSFIYSFSLQIRREWPFKSLVN